MWSPPEAGSSGLQNISTEAARWIKCLAESRSLPQSFKQVKVLFHSFTSHHFLGRKLKIKKPMFSKTWVIDIGYSSQPRCVCLVVWSLLLTTSLQIRFPLLCCRHNWEFVKNEGCSPVSFNGREERQLMNLYGEWRCCQRRFTWARHPSSRPIRGHCSSNAFSPGPLLHWFNYTAATDLLSRGKINCLRQKSQPISQGVEHCSCWAESGKVDFNCKHSAPGKENNMNSETAILSSQMLGGCWKPIMCVAWKSQLDLIFLILFQKLWSVIVKLHCPQNSRDKPTISFQVCLSKWSALGGKDWG